MATKLLITAEHCFCFKSRSVAIALATAPFDIALAPAFIDFDFMGGNMITSVTRLESRIRNLRARVLPFAPVKGKGID